VHLGVVDDREWNANRLLRTAAGQPGSVHRSAHPSSAKSDAFGVADLVRVVIGHPLST
jgi:hypothetical protein